MRRMLRAKLLASALAFCALPAVMMTAPAHAQYAEDVSFDSFHDQLAPYGNWLYSDRWGMVWQPTDVPDDFRPYYTDGHWVYTADFGWMWESDYDWGDIPFHYGRWVYDPDDGWLWIPGYTWAPAWVVWRSDEDYVAWMPMPPDDGFLEGGSDISFEFGTGVISFRWHDTDYGYRHWYGHDYDDRRFARNWVCVHPRDLGDDDYTHVAVRDPDRVITIIHQTRNITNYTVINNYVVNRSVNVHDIERAAGHRVEVVHTPDVFRHPNMVTTVDFGRRVRMENQPTIARGMGLPNSAPPPPRRVIESLSTHVAQPNGHQPMHLFTRSAVENPDVRAKFRGVPVSPSNRWNNTFNGANGNGNNQVPPPRNQGDRFFQQQRPANPIGESQPAAGNSFPTPNNNRTWQGRGTPYEHGPNVTNGPSSNAPNGNENTFPNSRRFEQGRAPQHQNVPNPMNAPSGQTGPGNFGSTGNQQFRERGNRAVPNEFGPGPNNAPAGQTGPGNFGPTENQQFREHGYRAMPNEHAPGPMNGPATGGPMGNGEGGFHHERGNGPAPQPMFEHPPLGNPNTGVPPSVTPHYNVPPQGRGGTQGQPSQQGQHNPPPPKGDNPKEKNRQQSEN